MILKLPEKTLSYILRPNVDCANVKLKNKDEMIFDPLNVSELFNEYFSSNANTLANKYSALIVKSIRDY